MMVLGGGTFGRCVGHEGEAFTSGISVLIRENAQRSLSLPRENTVRRCPLQTRKQALTRMQPRIHLDLELPSLHNCEK